MTRTRSPFSIGEEILAFADRHDEPMNIQIELRLSGRLEPDRLRSAIGSAMSVHPMMRARRSSRRFLLRRPRWEIGTDASHDVLGVQRADDESSLDTARADFYGQTITLSTAPAFRLLLAQRGDGDSLLFCAHHAVTDGIGGLRFLRSVSRAYAKLADPVADVDALATRDLRAQFGSAYPPRPKQVDRLRAMPGRPTFLAEDHESAGRGYGFSLISLSPAERHRLSPRRYGPACTLNDLLLAALHRSIADWNAEHGRDADSISVLMPVSLRPPEWYNEVVANLVMSGEVMSAPANRATAESLMSVVMEETQRIKGGDRFAAIFAIPRWVYGQIPLILLALCTLTRNQGRSAAVLTYFGRLDRDIPDFGKEAGDVVDVWGSPPAVRPMALAIGAGIYRGKLQIAIRYRRAVLDDSAARRFAALFMHNLFALGEGPSHDPAEPEVLERQSVGS